MWPFDEPRNQIPAGLPLPKLGPQPLTDPTTLKMLELEQRIFGLEVAIIEVCKAFKMHQDVCNTNFKTMEQSFLNLVQYVVKPRTQIMGEQKETN